MDTKKMIMAGLIIAIGLGVGVLIGHYAVPHAPKAAKDHKPLVGTTTPATAGASDALKALLEDVKKTPAQGGFVRRLVHAIDSAKIEEHLKFLAAEPHVAGTAREENDLANYIKEKFTEYGLDFVKIASYDVLLSYPNVSDPNTVQVLNISSGEVFFDAATQEDVIPGVNSDIGPAFLAYSPPNDVLGNLVYVNYGTNEDFDMLQQMGVDINGAVCLARYGNGYRGQKVRNCAARGGVGALLFLDPEQVAREGLDNVFPNSTWMPDTAMQRGSLMSVGDPMTPGVPALPSTERIDIAFAGLPAIAAQTIGYRDARILLGMLGGPLAPQSFVGGFNMTYRVGPFADEHADKYVRLRVNNLFSVVTVNNVIGGIEGAVEPDRVVITGNHRDAWGYGASSPSSGTAALLELARVLGQLKSKNVRPRRTVLLCSWAAGEYGLIGSTEWVEEHIIDLQAHAVGYIDVDQCASGLAFAPTSSPTFASAVQAAAHLVPDLTKPGSHQTLFDLWKSYVNEGSNSTEDPEPMACHGASDNAPFNFFAGVPTIGIGFVPDWKKYGTTTFPAYHTAYDTLYLYQNLIDKDMTLAKMCAQMNGAATILLSDSVLLPMDFRKLAQRLRASVDDMEARQIAFQLESVGISLGPLRMQIEKFRNASEEWHTYIDSLETVKPAFPGEAAERQDDECRKGLPEANRTPRKTPGAPSGLRAI
ncbi:aminopeptidase NAALADL1 [Ixodes scapularis]|uniref:aminopeptidase NAALADL1 n=1 Tax=Ixodes scapularis TaxID=6945 RepID=UPI001A9F1EC0|nr:aminopeptidase NAALADL1 [Ixodes scapularis]